MIKFRERLSSSIDLMSKVISHLTADGQPIRTIKLCEADSVSSTNSRSLVLLSFRQECNSYYQIRVMDKSAGRYIRKLLEDQLRFRITNVDESTRTITAEMKYEGIALDAIDVLGRKYDLYLVVDDKV